MSHTDAQWDEIELPDIVKDWEVGDSQEGYYDGQQVIPGSDGKDFTVLLFRREDGTTWSTALSAGLKPLMRDVQIGAYTRLTMTGERDTGKPAPMKEFKVQVRK
jgi:hypothetical protein